MADQITTVGIGVDTSQVASAATALDNMAKAGGRAESAATRLEKAHAALLNELRGIRTAIQDLGQLTAAENRATEAIKQRDRASAQSALSSLKASSAIKEEARSLAAIAPVAKQSSAAIDKLPLSIADINSAGIKNITAELSAAATQAARTVSAISNIQKVSRVTFNLPSLPNTTSQANSTRPSTATQNTSPAISNTANINNATRATRNLASAQADQAKAARLAAFQNQQLGFQLNDFFVQVASGGGVIRPLIQQGSQLSGTFGGIGNAFRAVTSLLTPARVGFGLLASAIAAVGYAAYKSAEQQREFKDAILLTGNAVGTNYGKFKQLAEQVAQSTSAPITKVKEIGQALISTGEITDESLTKATQSAVLYQKATGKTVEEVTALFVDLARSPTDAAQKINRSMNFLTAGQIQTIKKFQENGESAKALGIIYDALNDRTSRVKDNMGLLDKALAENSRLWGIVKDKFNTAFDDETVEQRIAKLQEKLESLNTTIKKLPNGLSIDPGGRERAKVEADLQGALSEKAENDRRDAFKAEDARRQKAGTTAKELIDNYVKQGKAAETLKEKTEQLNKAFNDAEAAGVGASKQERADATVGLQKQFANPETGQLLQAALQRDIKAINDAFTKERDSISFNERFLQGEYQAGRESLESLYKGKREAIEKGVEAEVKALEDENKRLAQFAKQTKDPSEREQTKTKIVENNTEIERARLNASRDVKLLNQEQAASFKQLDDSVSNYRANLLQLQGDEEGAAKVRAQTAIENARILSAQSVRSGRSTIDVEGLAKATEIQNQFNEVQRRSQFLSSAARTAEEAFARAAEERGLSQKDADTGVYLIRQKELEQLGALARKAQELAEVSTDPRIKQFAAELTNEYAKAAAAVDPALQRLRDANKELAQGLASTIGNLPTTFAEAYKRRRDDSLNDIKSQKDEYNRRIDILEGYLAESQDKQDKARLREKIKNLESERDSKKKTSKLSSAFGALNDSLIQPAVQQVTTTLNKALFADPLQKKIEGQLKTLTEGDGPLASFFKEAFGVKTDPHQQIALDAQTEAVRQSTNALDIFAEAAKNAANAIPGANNQSPDNASNSAFPVPIDSDLEGLVDDFGGSLEEANNANVDFSKNVPTVVNALTKLASASTNANASLSLLPSIVSAISAASATNSASSSGGGIFGALFSMFSNSGSSGEGSGAMSNEVFHDGGIVGNPSTRRTTSVNIFSNATKYHTGGIAGLSPDEVPAILMGGPKGKREEVLKADDPRHRDNLGHNALAAIMKESKYNHLRPRGNRALGGDVSSGSLYRVNENKPELLDVAGKQYLMMGNQAGQIKETGNSNDNQKQVVLHMHFNNGGQPVDRRTADQLAAAASAGLRRTSMRNS